MWLLEEPIDHGSLTELANYIVKVQNIPYKKRQLPEY